jgi:lipopolysaccharide export system permease protein
MKIIRNYILANFTSIFISMFMPLFVIATVIFLIKLATYTAVIQLSIAEMTKLYIFVLPEILFYTLPITFFIAATLTLLRLSNENELIVLFSLGIKPGFIIKTLFKPAMILTTLLIFDFFILFPHAKVLSHNFISYKKSEAKFNLAANEYGNSFGEWLLYLGTKENDNLYGDVFLFNKNKEEEILISAKKAELENDSGVLKLKLTKGEGYSYSKKKFTQINFDTMTINNTMKTNLTHYNKPLDYWISVEDAKYKRNRFITNLLLSLFPIISLYIIASIGIVQERHQKSNVYAYLFISILIYYAFTLKLQSYIAYYSIPAIAFGWMFITYIIYRYKILRKY